MLHALALTLFLNTLGSPTIAPEDKLIYRQIGVTAMAQDNFWFQKGIVYDSRNLPYFFGTGNDEMDRNTYTDIIYNEKVKAEGGDASKVNRQWIYNCVYYKIFIYDEKTDIYNTFIKQHPDEFTADEKAKIWSDLEAWNDKVQYYNDQDTCDR